jgi:hypothetical protein
MREPDDLKGLLMFYLAVAVGALAAVTLLNLILTFAIIRRLREQASEASTSAGAAPGPAIAGVGERPGEFTAVDTEGEPVTGGGHRLIAFFSPGCQACHEKLPYFVTQAADYPGGSSRVLAAIVGGEAGESEFTGALRDVARVVLEPHAAAMQEAFQVKGFPTWCILDDEGIVRHSGIGIDRLPIPVAP